MKFAPQMPAFQAPRLRVQANYKTIVFHHSTGGISSALGGFKINSKGKGSLAFDFKSQRGALKISLTSGGETAKYLLSRLEPEGRHGKAMKFAPVAVVPETLSPLD